MLWRREGRGDVVVAICGMRVGLLRLSLQRQADTQYKAVLGKNCDG